MFVLILIAIVFAGVAAFVGQYFAKADEWVVFPGSPHIYSGGNLTCGVVSDRDGEVLLDSRSGLEFSDDAEIRASFIHLLGDRNGSIYAPMLGEYAERMIGYNKITGLYIEDGGEIAAKLTVDADVQKTALQALDGRRGTVGVYNYKTGEILCAVTTPTFDPDDPIDLTAVDPELYEGVYLNRFAQSTYIPGSIFKVVTAAAALDCIPDIGEREFTCSGTLEYGEEKVSCERVHGTQDLKLALANSCNCAFAQVAELIGKDRMTDYVDRFGITDPISFDGVTTAKGNYDVSDTAPVSFAWSCIGQYTDLINPCRFMTFMGAIASGGSGAQPYIVSHVTGGGETTYSAQIREMEPILSQDVAEKLQAYMRGNVELIYGAGNFPGLTVCAKSGTSQLGAEQVSNAMFSGFVTDPEYPLAFIVVVENGGYGASACVPVLSRVLDACKTVLDGE